MNLAYHWFRRLGLDVPVTDHSSFSKNRHGRFRERHTFRHLSENSVQRCMSESLVKGEGFSVDASHIKADVNRQTAVQGNELSSVNWRDSPVGLEFKALGIWETLDVQVEQNLEHHDIRQLVPAALTDACRYAHDLGSSSCNLFIVPYRHPFDGLWTGIEDPPVIGGTLKVERSAPLAQAPGTPFRTHTCAAALPFPRPRSMRSDS